MKLIAIDDEFLYLEGIFQYKYSTNIQYFSYHSWNFKLKIELSEEFVNWKKDEVKTKSFSITRCKDYDVDYYKMVDLIKEYEKLGRVEKANYYLHEYIESGQYYQANIIIRIDRKNKKLFRIEDSTNIEIKIHEANENVNIEGTLMIKQQLDVPNTRMTKEAWEKWNVENPIGGGGWSPR